MSARNMVFLLDQYILLSLGFQITTMRTPVYHSTAMRIIAVLAPIPTAMIIAAALDIDLVAVKGARTLGCQWRTE
jgi:hypothetical protein